MIGYPLDSHVEFGENNVPVFDRAITSVPLRKLINELFTDGIMPNIATNMQVAAGSGMEAVVKAGFAICNGCLKLEEEQTTLTLEAADATYGRIDTIVLRLDDNDNARSCEFAVVKGTVSANPVRPTLTRNQSVWELGLADIKIPAKSVAIRNDRITDTRYESNRCGVISSISEFDTTGIYQQVQADLEELKAEEQSVFDLWFESVKEQLGTDAAGSLLKLIEVERERINALTSLKDGSTTGDAELQDIRVGANGKTYSSAGEAVRQQYLEVSEDISKIREEIGGAWNDVEDNDVLFGSSLKTYIDMQEISLGQQFTTSSNVLTDSTAVVPEIVDLISVSVGTKIDISGNDVCQTAADSGRYGLVLTDADWNVTEIIWLFDFKQGIYELKTEGHLFLFLPVHSKGTYCYSYTGAYTAKNPTLRDEMRSIQKEITDVRADMASQKTDADFVNSLSMGRRSGTVVGENSTALGKLLEASGTRSHAEGYYARATATDSHAEGYFTIASGKKSHVQGKYNVADTEDKYAHIVGGGTNTNTRKNIHTVDWDGNAEYAGDVIAGGCGGEAPVSLQDVKKSVENITESVENITKSVENVTESVKETIEDIEDVSNIVNEEYELIPVTLDDIKKSNMDKYFCVNNSGYYSDPKIGSVYTVTTGTVDKTGHCIYEAEVKKGDCLIFTNAHDLTSSTSFIVFSWDVAGIPVKASTTVYFSKIKNAVGMKYTFLEDGVFRICFDYTTIQSGEFFYIKRTHRKEPYVLYAEKAESYVDDADTGEAVMKAIMEGRQIVIRVPNADGGKYMALYSPVLMYQLPNYLARHLYLFYLNDGVDAMGLPSYSQLKIAVSRDYNQTPLS